MPFFQGDWLQLSQGVPVTASRPALLEEAQRGWRRLKEASPDGEKQEVRAGAHPENPAASATYAEAPKV